MRYLFYYYNAQGYLVLSYTDGNGRHAERSYLYYSRKEAIRLFRERYGLRYKHITVQRLF